MCVTSNCSTDMACRISIFQEIRYLLITRWERCVSGRTEMLSSATSSVPSYLLLSLAIDGSQLHYQLVSVFCCKWELKSVNCSIKSSREMSIAKSWLFILQLLLLLLTSSVFIVSASETLSGSFSVRHPPGPLWFIVNSSFHSLAPPRFSHVVTC